MAIVIDFRNIEYLKLGNDRQQKAYADLATLNVFENLKTYNPLLTGTIPIDIDIPDSDLDIICECSNHIEFSARLMELFANQIGFHISTSDWNGIECTIATFKTPKFAIEFFGQNIPTEKQNAYRHMLIEYQILTLKGKEFKAAIRQLKLAGMKTEPAFAKLLGLKGNPYEELLTFELHK